MSWKGAGDKGVCGVATVWLKFGVDLLAGPIC